MGLKETAQRNTYLLKQVLIASPYAIICKINQLHTYYVFNTGLDTLCMKDGKIPDLKGLPNESIQ